MPLLEIKPTKRVTILCTLEESIATQVDQYAQFVQGTADEVINKALEYALGKDAEFQKHRIAHPQVSGTLRIKKAAHVSTSPVRRGPKPRATSTAASLAAN